jgi:hypothetical protein
VGSENPIGFLFRPFPARIAPERSCLGRYVMNVLELVEAVQDSRLVWYEFKMLSGLVVSDGHTELGRATPNIPSFGDCDHNAQADDA